MAENETQAQKFPYVTDAKPAPQWMVDWLKEEIKKEQAAPGGNAQRSHMLGLAGMLFTVHAPDNR